VRVVIDTNVVVAALRRPDKAPRRVLRLCLERTIVPLMGNALFAEYEDVMSRDAPFAGSPITAAERANLLDALAAAAEWVRVYFLWRPNLPDEGDNHLIELAIAGGADWLISANLRDLGFGEMTFPDLRIGTARQFMVETGL